MSAFRTTCITANRPGLSLLFPEAQESEEFTDVFGSGQRLQFHTRRQGRAMTHNWIYTLLWDCRYRGTLDLSWFINEAGPALPIPDPLSDNFDVNGSWDDDAPCEVDTGHAPDFTGVTPPTPAMWGDSNGESYTATMIFVRDFSEAPLEGPPPPGVAIQITITVGISCIPWVYRLWKRDAQVDYDRDTILPTSIVEFKNYFADGKLDIGVTSFELELLSNATTYPDEEIYLAGERGHTVTIGTETENHWDLTSTGGYTTFFLQDGGLFFDSDLPTTYNGPTDHPLTALAWHPLVMRRTRPPASGGLVIVDGDWAFAPRVRYDARPDI